MADEILTTKEVAAVLGVTPQRVAAWVRRGLPVESRNGSMRFRASKIEKWLLARGLIAARAAEEPTGGILRTRAEVARHFGVNEHTVSYWHRRPGFPGRPGTPEAQGLDGYYPIAEIQAWREQQGHRAAMAGSGMLEMERSKLISIQCQERELRLQKQRGELVLLQEVAAFLRRTVHQASSLLDELPDRIMAHVPPSAGDDARRAIRSEVSGVIADMRVLIGELVSGDADEHLGE